MPILSFVVPTNSRARVYVSADLLIHAPDVDATWRDLTDNVNERRATCSIAISPAGCSSCATTTGPRP